MNYLNFATRIGDLLLANTILDDTAPLDIYRGCAGNLLFYIELYRQTEQTKYLDFIKKESQYLSDQALAKPIANCSWYVGTIGVAYALHQAACLLEQDIYHQKVLEIVKAASPTDKLQQGHINDLLSGAAGVIQGLLRLHAFYQQDFILDDVYVWYQRLMSQVHLSQTGLYFDRRLGERSGLCGFSHGSAGISFMFLELGYYFKNEAFYALANATLTHENAYFVPEQHNWQDLRFLEGDDAKLEEQLNQNKQVEFPVRAKFAAWCNGAPGIGLTALRGYELTGAPQYKAILDETVINTKESLGRLNDYSLCHGVAGNALILWDMYQYLQNDDLKEVVHQAARQLMTNTTQEDILQNTALNPTNSLLLGAAGLGYFMLLLSTEATKDQVLYPTLDKTCAGMHAYFSQITAHDLFNEVYTYLYPKTMFMLRQNHIELAHTTINIQPFRDSFTRNLQQVVEGVDNEYLQDVWLLEKTLVKLRNGHDHNNLIEAKRKVAQQQNKQLLETDWQNTRLVLSDLVIVLQTKWDWLGDDWKNNEIKPADEHFVIAYSQTQGVAVQAMNEFAYWVMDTFKSAGTLNEKIEYLSQVFDMESPEELAQIKQLVREQVTQALLQGFVVLA